MLEGPAQSVLGREAQHLLGGRIEELDLESLVECNDSVHRGLDDSAYTPLEDSQVAFNSQAPKLRRCAGCKNVEDRQPSWVGLDAAVIHNCEVPENALVVDEGNAHVAFGAHVGERNIFGIQRLHTLGMMNEVSVQYTFTWCPGQFVLEVLEELSAVPECKRTNARVLLDELRDPALANVERVGLISD